MSQLLKLDTLVTMLTCLSTTQNQLSSIIGVEQLEMDNMTNTCPISALRGLTTRLENLATDINDIREKIGILQEQVVDLSRSRDITRPIITSRFLAPISDEFSSVPLVNIFGNGVPRNCVNQRHGIVRIQTAPHLQSFHVFCDQETRGGGWILVANRYDGSEDFNRGWQDYRIGFGALTTEFFAGMDKLHMITNSDNYELLLILENRKQEQRHAIYKQFSIGSENEKYILNVLGEYSGDAADALRPHAGKKFSTYDQDNDDSEQHCALEQSGAWWYADTCQLSNLFGLYQRLLERDVDGYKGILWNGFLDGPKGSLKVVRMLLRPTSNCEN